MGRRRWLVRSDVFLWVGVVFGLGVGLRLWQGMEMEAGAEMPSRIVLTRETLQVQVIHYTKLVERKAHMERVLTETGLDQCRVRWVTEGDQEVVRQGGQYERGEWGDPGRIAAGSISLILKHIAAWQTVASREDSWHLILEDDVLVPSGAAFIQELQEVVNELPTDKWDLLFVGLGCHLHVPWWKQRVGKRVYFRGWQRGWLWGGGGCSRCTEAYLIHPAFASKLLATRFVKPPFDRPIDWLLNEVGADLKARSFWAEPPLVTQGAFESWTKEGVIGDQ